MKLEHFHLCPTQNVREVFPNTVAIYENEASKQKVLEVLARKNSGIDALLCFPMLYYSFSDKCYKTPTEVVYCDDNRVQQISRATMTISKLRRLCDWLDILQAGFRKPLELLNGTLLELSVVHSSHRLEMGYALHKLLEIGKPDMPNFVIINKICNANYHKIFLRELALQIDCEVFDLVEKIGHVEWQDVKYDASNLEEKYQFAKDAVFHFDAFCSPPADIRDMAFTTYYYSISKVTNNRINSDLAELNTIFSAYKLVAKRHNMAQAQQSLNLGV